MNRVIRVIRVLRVMRVKARHMALEEGAMGKGWGGGGGEKKKKEGYKHTAALQAYSLTDRQTEGGRQRDI